MTQKEYLPLHKLEHNQTQLLGKKKEKSIEPYRVEIVGDDFLAQKKNEKKDNFLYDTPGILNDTQVIFINKIM